MTWPSPQTVPQQGWQCPVCRNVYAPWMAVCTNCKAEPTTTIRASSEVRCLARDPHSPWQQCALLYPHDEVPHRWADST